MSLTPEQKQTVATWVAAGDNLSAIQKKLVEDFKVSMTYMDVRFLVDDLGLELKNAAPKADTSDVSKGPVPPPPAEAPAPAAAPDEAGDDLPPPEGDLPAGGVTVELDRIMRPGMMVSGSVTFSDGVAGKWALDQMGRLMLDTPQPGYQPSAPDVQAFQRELQAQIQRSGF